MLICGYNSITKLLGGKIIDENAEGKNSIKGNPADPQILIKAGIKKEDTIIIAMDSDEKNIYVTLLARELNPKIKIAVVVKKKESVSKVYGAGADYVVLESEIVGKEILRYLLAPKVASFIERVIVSEELQLIGLKLPKVYVGKKIKDTDIRKKIGLIIAIKRGNDLIKNPAPDTILNEGDILIFLLQGKEINKIRGIMGQWILQKG
ncbi:TrkA family potassium uptake protein [Candidatus Aciduliprofundum boonei]|uniref:TrkA-N domain protein n=1 Tax=Aciduliprofundum boonei (strain DSM 19572 / T469) TaxID=439481 RepID=D3TCE4_ACIB4|nr:NAD-binding protein [Candidatus Aciduliprofundum boonei]ADD08229.1 TrkA-N domain protein [Aciduliprofundum boonei T469]HII55781.1 TrkA family potassium uptake protein [Candidatus Aciduliprofundum boonei]